MFKPMLHAPAWERSRQKSQIIIRFPSDVDLFVNDVASFAATTAAQAERVG